MAVFWQNLKKNFEQKNAIFAKNRPKMAENFQNFGN